MASPARLFEEHRAREKFQRFHDRLRLGVAIGDARRHLDPLVEACEDYLDRAGDSELTVALRAQLRRTQRIIECRHILLGKKAAND
jgi:hypothetical protein